MGKKTLKLDSAGDEISKKNSSLRGKGRPRKSLMRQHRRESLQAELADQPSSPQDESPLLNPTEGGPQQPDMASTTKSEKPSRPMRMLSSASLFRSKKAETGNEKDKDTDKNQCMDTHENDQSPIPSARRSTIMSWRNSTTSIVEDSPPAACPLSCQPSACFIGSLNGTISEMHLPLLTKQTKARMDALKAAPPCQLEVTIERSDELPFGAYSHPRVRIHFVDRCTGRALCPPQMTGEAKFSNGSDNNASCTNAFEWQQPLDISMDMLTFLSTRTALLFEILETKAPRKRSRFLRRKSFEPVSTHDDDEDDYIKTHKAPSTPDYRRIAWGFFHTITSKGTPTMDSFVLPRLPDEKMTPNKLNIVDVCGLRVRLFEYQVLTWMDTYQAKSQWGWRKNHPTVPAVFLQYQKRSRVPAPSTLHVQLRAVSPATSPQQASTPEASGTAASANVGITSDQDGNTAANYQTIEAGDNQEPPAEVSTEPVVEETGDNNAPPVIESSDIFDLIAPCKRNVSESCLIPQRVLCSLPTGKKGCSAISFSPCGRYLAASVSPELGEFVVQVYQMASAELFALGRGHRGVIYSLNWTIKSTGQYRLLSASSDGTVRLWELPSNSDSPRVSASRHSRLLSLVFQWHHFPCFVYCAVFLPGSDGEIVLTGASDGCIRFRKVSAVPNVQSEVGTLQVSATAVHTICVETKSGRVFCGDANGGITVWRRTQSASTLSDYERIKMIHTGQTCITSLQLHPRKGHLLVHTQPNAIFQYELRSYLLLNKSYAGVSCESLLVKSTFSPDGKLVISGSEDGVPRLFTSLHGQQLQRGVWGTHFFHGCPVLDVSWSPTAHMAALCSYGGNNPIVVLCSYRDDKDAAHIDESAANNAANTALNLQQLAIGAFRGGNQKEALSGDHAQRLQRALERRHKRLQAKLSLETEASKDRASVAV